MVHLVHRLLSIITTVVNSGDNSVSISLGPYPSIIYHLTSGSLTLTKHSFGEANQHSFGASITSPNPIDFCVKDANRRPVLYTASNRISICD